MRYLLILTALLASNVFAKTYYIDDLVIKTSRNGQIYSFKTTESCPKGYSATQVKE